MGNCCGGDKNDSNKPPKFPTSIDGKYDDTDTWARDPLFAMEKVFHAQPKTEDDIVAICNFAAEHGYKVRPIGVRHNWSPLTNAPKTSEDAKLIFVDMRAHFNKFEGVESMEDGRYGIATTQAGISQIEFLTGLEKAEGGTAGIGWGVPHCPAPDSITIGGVLTIDGHGTGFNIEGETSNHGSMSNRIMELRICAFNKETKKYEMRDIKRTDPFGPAVQTHLGRILVTRAKLRVEPNHYLRCKSILNLTADQLFAAPNEDGTNPENSFGAFLDKCGRGEIIWYPFTTKPWLKTWEVTGNEMPKGSKKVSSALNYPFSDQMPTVVTLLFKSLVGTEVAEGDWTEVMGNFTTEIASIPDDDDDESTPKTEIMKESANLAKEAVLRGWGNPSIAEPLGELMYTITAAGLKGENVADIWGPSKNCLIYVRDTTLRVTANGYAVQMKRKDIQRGCREFTQLYERLLNKYKAEGKFPIACPLEIRVTGIDNAEEIGPGETPWLSAVNNTKAKEHGWDVALWLDVLSLPGAKWSNEFYEEMEQEMMKNEFFQGSCGMLRPEWSKGWGYSSETGAWTKSNFRQHTKQSFEKWDNAIDAFAELDGKNIFNNSWLENFLEK